MATGETERRRAVDRQVERVLDTTSGRYRDVIVRVRDDDDAEAVAFARAAAAGFGRRRLALSARDVLPADRATIEARSAARGRRKLRDREFSVASRMAARPGGVGEGITGAGLAAARRSAMAALAPVLDAEPVRAAMGRCRDADAAPAFWASRSFAASLTPDELRRLVEVAPTVAEVTANRTLHVPPYVETPVRAAAESAATAAVASWGLRRIGALSAWGAYGARGAGATVAVLDTGVDAGHPALAGKIAHWAEFDRQGRAVPGSTPQDSDRHGTHVAGTIAGGQADGGWIGVAPEARIAAALVLNGAQGGTDAQILAALSWAIDLGVDVINLSLGGLGFGPDVPTTYTRSIVSALRAGVPVVAAIGNDGHQTSGSPGNDPFSLSVGATDRDDRVAAFSGGRTQIIRESPFIDPNQLPFPYSTPQLSAPGVEVVSCVPGGGTAAFSGTSMATPHVAGAMALLLSATALGEQPAEERAFLMQDLLAGAVEELGEAGQDHRYGFGRLDVFAAIAEARRRGF